MPLPRPDKIYGKPVKYEPLFEGIRYNRNGTTDDEMIVDILVPAPIFVRRSGEIVLSAEDNTESYFADYYGEYAPKGYKGCAWVHERLEKWASDHDCFWEWENAGCLILYRI